MVRKVLGSIWKGVRPIEIAGHVDAPQSVQLTNRGAGEESSHWRAAM
jgi:hypothetical protein